MGRLLQILRKATAIIPDIVFYDIRLLVRERHNRQLMRMLKSVGTDVVIAHDVTILSAPFVTIGPDTRINEYVHILGGGGVTIGRGVWIANHAAIISVTHPVDVEYVSHHPEETRPVVIEDHVWIGSHAVILPGVRLGRSCVVAAGSVVTKDVPPYAVVAGVPATVKRYKTLAPNTAATDNTN